MAGPHHQVTHKGGVGEGGERVEEVRGGGATLPLTSESDGRASGSECDWSSAAFFFRYKNDPKLKFQLD